MEAERMREQCKGALRAETVATEGRVGKERTGTEGDITLSVIQSLEPGWMQVLVLCINVCVNTWLLEERESDLDDLKKQE